MKGNVALVTGASRGIGRAVALKLAAEGLRVILTARRKAELDSIAGEIRKSGGEAHVCLADVRDEGEVVTMAREAAQVWGQLDVLVNSAGVALQSALRDGEPADWEAMWKVNVHGLALVTRESLRFLDPDGGQIVNLCSMSGHRVPGKGGFYSATKFAVRAMTEGLRQELRGDGSRIRVSQISPGFVDTEMLNDYFRAQGGNRHEQVGYAMLQAEDIAETIWQILTAPPHVDVTDVLLRPTAQQT